MHEVLLELHNKAVKPGDHVSFLGDVTLKRGGRVDKEMFIKEMRKYNGHKRLYLGNHDHFPIKVYLDAGFEKIYATWRSEEGFICSHIPLHPRALYGVTANVHGHIHQNRDYPALVIEQRDKRKKRDKIVPYINVCCEPLGYTPIHLDQILFRIKNANK